MFYTINRSCLAFDIMEREYHWQISPIYGLLFFIYGGWFFRLNLGRLGVILTNIEKLSLKLDWNSEWYRWVQKRKGDRRRIKEEICPIEAKQQINEETNEEEKQQIESGYEFELFLIDLFSRLGYNTTHIGQSGDQGVDIVLEDQLTRIAVQAKWYSTPVNNKAIQEVYAGMKYHHCSSCAVVTNSYFTQGAIDLAQSVGCILIDGDALELLINTSCKTDLIAV